MTAPMSSQGANQGRTQVGIIGAGPAGLMLAHLLQRAGIDCVLLESRSRFHVENRLRAAVLEHDLATLLRQVGLGERMDRVGIPQEGIRLHAAPDHAWRIDLAAHTGRTAMLWGQYELVRDLIAARLDAGAPLLFNVDAVRLDDLDTHRPRINYRHDGEVFTLDCDFIAGCDGFNGICRAALPSERLAMHQHAWPFSWFGILTEADPAWPELVYGGHPDGFALASMRPPGLTRFFFQCDPDEDVHSWSTDRIWQTLHRRLDAGGTSLGEGHIIQRSIIPLRSAVTETMQHGRLYLLGDAAHLLPPTGAKGLNVAVHDAVHFATAVRAWYAQADFGPMARFSEERIEAIWNAQRFCASMTRLLHRMPGEDSFGYRLRLAEIAYLAENRFAARSFAESYVGSANEEMLEAYLRP